MWIALATAWVVIVLHATLLGWTARALGIRVRGVVLFVGPRLLSFRALGLPFELRAVPVGSHVLLAPDAASERREVVNTRPDVERELDLDVRDLAWGHRAILALVPWAVIFAPTLAVLGADAFVELMRGMMQFFAGLAFWSEGPAHVSAMWALFASTTGLRIAALTVVKLVAMNLLPIPGLSGGLILPRTPTWLVVASTLVVLATAVGWVVSFVAVG